MREHDRISHLGEAIQVEGQVWNFTHVTQFFTINISLQKMSFQSQNFPQKK